MIYGYGKFKGARSRSGWRVRAREKERKGERGIKILR